MTLIRERTCDGFCVVTTPRSKVIACFSRSDLNPGMNYALCSQFVLCVHQVSVALLLHNNILLLCRKCHVSTPRPDLQDAPKMAQEVKPFLLLVGSLTWTITLVSGNTDLFKSHFSFIDNVCARMKCVYVANKTLGKLVIYPENFF